MKYDGSDIPHNAKFNTSDSSTSVMKALHRQLEVSNRTRNKTQHLSIVTGVTPLLGSISSPRLA